MIGRGKRWLIRQWNLKSRAFAAWRQKHYFRWVEFYAIERSIWKLRRSGKIQPSAGRAIIAKPTRQLARAIGRKLRKADEAQRKVRDRRDRSARDRM